MKANSHDSQAQQIEEPMDFFPKSTMYPEGWDLSEMYTSSDSGFEVQIKPNNSEETGSSQWDNY